ncbi:hypothetical protein Q4E40_03085 [Pontibacter sp. BT731]|uniref:hypothetical protein n=1 Tax=Pontibacter coccineus TaxID=3063328 RepID=UPI0026E21BEE|nr:hypothetical protein [Pontibacter sp. BT731]MDO6389096.1 hypothetical protein [Pontibacter sp. BT731]
MKTYDTEIKLIAQNVERNLQVVNISCSLCHNQIEYLRSETALIKRVLMENRQILKDIMRVLERHGEKHKLLASVTASLDLALVFASVAYKNLEILAQTNI